MTNVSCKSSGKKGHFAKVCNFRKNVDNIDEESDGTADEECNFIMSLEVNHFFSKNKKIAYYLLFLNKIFIQFTCFHNVQTKLKKTSCLFLNAVNFDLFIYFGAFLNKNCV